MIRKRVKKKEPVIKFNGGNPVCLCINCRITIGYVQHNPLTKVYTYENSEVPLFCSTCKSLKNILLNKIQSLYKT